MIRVDSRKPPFGAVVEVSMAEQEFINITPSSDGYAMMAAVFAEDILGNIRKSDRERMTSLLGSVINISAHLGNAAAQDDADAIKAYEWLVERFPAK
jgi:hypothetical protein